MTPQELDILSRQVFKHLAENLPAWMEVPISPNDPEDLEQAAGYKKWIRSNCPLTTQSRYESNRKLIMDAERYLRSMGYKCSRIRKPYSNHESVRVAHAGNWRLCTSIPQDIAERIIVLGLMPDLQE
jgi:hypothetical protein